MFQIISVFSLLALSINGIELKTLQLSRKEPIRNHTRIYINDYAAEQLTVELDWAMDLTISNDGPDVSIDQLTSQGKVVGSDVVLIDYQQNSLDVSGYQDSQFHFEFTLQVPLQLPSGSTNQTLNDLNSTMALKDLKDFSGKIFHQNLWSEDLSQDSLWNFVRQSQKRNCSFLSPTGRVKIPYHDEHSTLLNITTQVSLGQLLGLFVKQPIIVQSYSLLYCYE